MSRFPRRCARCHLSSRSICVTVDASYSVRHADLLGETVRATKDRPQSISMPGSSCLITCMASEHYRTAMPL